MNFLEILNKVNLRIKSLYLNSNTDVESGGVEIRDHLLMLESKFPEDWNNWLNNQSFVSKLNELTKQINDKLVLEKKTYTIVPELNCLFIKDQNNHVVKEVNLAQIDSLLKKHLNIDNNHEFFYLIKSVLVKNYRLDIIALTEGLL